jgi:photosystem II stability/assembly factor-like uncharacterized protein
VWGSGPLDVYAVGDVEMRTTDGAATWTSHSFSLGWLSGVWGSSSQDIYVVSTKGEIFHTSDNGTTWNPQVSGTTNALNGVWGSDSSNIFVSGFGTILYSNGSGTWTMQTPPVNGLRAIWGSGKSDIYAVGAGGILHSDGSGAWVSQLLNNLRGVWGSGPGDVYCVGLGGMSLHLE